MHQFLPVSTQDLPHTDLPETPGGPCDGEIHVVYGRNDENEEGNPGQNIRIDKIAPGRIV